MFEVYILNYKMVIRHHLLLAGEEKNKAALDKSANSNTAAPTASKTTNITLSSTTNAANTSASKIDPNTNAAKSSSSPPPTTTPQQSNETTNSKATVSSSSTTSPTSTVKPPPTNSPAANTASQAKTSSPPPAPTTNTTNSSSASTKSVTAVPVSSTASNNNSNKQLSINPTAKSASSATENSSTHHGGHIFGISTTFLIELGIVLAVVAIIVIIIIILYKRYQTRKVYNDSPENFAHKPDLSFTEDYHLNHSKMQPIVGEDRVAIDAQEQLAGRIYQVEFKGTEKSAVLYHRRQKTTAYFQIEVLQANAMVEIGFIPCENRQKLKKGNQSIGTVGVGVSNTGFVHAQGQNIYNYSWSLAYGDVFGIGITPQNSKFSQRRAWISKNGVLLNFPPNDEMDKWLATIEISAEEKNTYNLGTEKKDVQQVAGEKLDQKQMREKAQRQKSEALLKKQRISLKTFNEFNYYPVVVCHGNKTVSQTTKVNVNVGGQVFRMCDTQFRSGLLRDTGFFG